MNGIDSIHVRFDPTEGGANNCAKLSVFNYDYYYYELILNVVEMQRKWNWPLESLHSSLWFRFTLFPLFAMNISKNKEIIIEKITDDEERRKCWRKKKEKKTVTTFYFILFNKKKCIFWMSRNTHNKSETTISFLGKKKKTI